MQQRVRRAAPVQLQLGAPYVFCVLREFPLVHVADRALQLTKIASELGPVLFSPVRPYCPAPVPSQSILLLLLGKRASALE